MIIAEVLCPTAEKCVSMVGLFECPKTRCAALCVAAAAFVLGVLVPCIACRLRRKSSCVCAGKGAATRKPAQQKAVKGTFEKRHLPPADGSIEIYVGNLSYDLTEDVLRREFEAFGKVNSARIITNRYNGRSKGFGFVHMPNRAEADAAVKALNDKDLLGRRLKCNEARNDD